MRKNFLLLFLMALLPLAGWAGTNVTVTLYDFTVPYGTAVDVSTLPADAVKVENASWDDIKGYLTFSSTEAAEATYNVGTYNYTLTKAASTGEYTIYLTSNNAKMTIVQATNAWTTSPAVIATGAAWTGNDIDLLATLGAAKFGTVEYSIDGTTWAETMPKAKDAGTYPVQARVVATANYTGLTYSGDATILGADITEYTEPAAIAGLEYTSEAQNLITAASSTQGTPMYKIGATGTYKETIPQGTAAGTYTVYWYIKGDNSHQDKVEVSFDVTIGKGTPTISTVPALIAGYTYDGKEHAIIGTNGVATLAADITYQLQKKSGDSWGNDGSATTTPADLKIKKAGEYRVVYSVAANANVEAVAAAQTAAVTVAPAPLTATIKGCSKIYGAADPALEVVYTGFVNSETADALEGTGEFTKGVATREAGTDVGYYALSFSTHPAADNYEITENTSNFLLINPKSIGEVSVTLGAAPVYDGTPKEANITKVEFDGGTRTLYNAETGLGDYTVTYDGTTNIAAGSNAEMTITGKNNYTGSVVKKFTIDGAALYIIPTAAEKTYGAADPTEFAYTLKVGDETVPNTTLNGTVELARVAGENVGTYKIYVKGYTAGTTPDNYVPANLFNNPTSTDASNKTALFTIKAVEGNVLKLKFDAALDDAKKTKVYDGTTDVTALGFGIDDLVYVEGLVGTDSWDDVKNNIGTPVFTLANANAGATTLGVTGLGSPNYPTVEVATLDFTVTKKKVTVTVNDQTLNYGEALKQVEATNWALGATDYVGTETNAQAGVVLYTEKEISLYAPGSVNEKAIKAKIDKADSNYEVDETTSTWGKLTINDATGLTLVSGDGDLDAITAYDGQTQNVTINFATRSARPYTWQAGEYATMTLPFDISVADLSKALGYAVVNVIDPERTVVDGTSSKFYGKLTMKGGNGNDEKLAANKPFIVKTADAITGAINFGSQKIIAPAAAADLSVDAGKGATFTGTYAKKTVLPADNKAFWFMTGEHDKWLYIGSNGSWDILPFEGFIDMSAISVSARNMTFFFEDIDGTTTVIKGISTEDLDSKQNVEGWYNLNGVKMENAPTQKGIYILNGKKVVIK